VAQDITGKQVNFVARYQAAVVGLLNANALMGDLKSEWDANGYATGAPPISGVNWNIPDGQVQVAIPAADAAMLNSAVGAAETIRNTVATNIGYLIVLKP
jgi:hypothetical protein